MTQDIELKIDPEFASLCPPLTAEEHEKLAASLMAEGCRDAVIVWQGQGIVVDGHTRVSICRANGLPFTVREMPFESREDVVAWIVNNQLARRNLTEEQKADLRGHRYRQEKKSVTNPDGLGGKAGKIDGAHTEHHQSTAERIAKEFGVSAATIRRDGIFSEAVDEITKNCGEDAKAAVLFGTLGPMSSIVKLAQLPAEQQRAAIAGGKEGVKEATSKPRKRPTTLSTKAIEIRRLVEQEKVDRDAACGRIGLAVREYRQAVAVVNAGNEELIHALDSGLVEPSVAAGLAKLPAEEVAQKLIENRVKKEEQRRKAALTPTPTSKVLMDILEMTILNWDGLVKHHQINERTMPKGDNLKYAVRQCALVRKYVIPTLEQIERELEKCSEREKNDAGSGGGDSQ